MTGCIQNREDLIHYLTTKQVARKTPPTSVNVTTKIRRLILTGEMQGKFVDAGTVKRFKFDSIGGGVYEASVVSLMVK
jgi:hypothetical protein